MCEFSLKGFSLLSRLAIGGSWILDNVISHEVEKFCLLKSRDQESFHSLRYGNLITIVPNHKQCSLKVIFPRKWSRRNWIKDQGAEAAGSQAKKSLNVSLLGTMLMMRLLLLLAVWPFKLQIARRSKNVAPKTTTTSRSLLA